MKQNTYAHITSLLKSYGKSRIQAVLVKRYPTVLILFSSADVVKRAK